MSWGYGCYLIPRLLAGGLGMRLVVSLICSRLAVLQLAVAGAVFLLDMVHLPRRVREKTLRQFVSEVFGSANTLKLGVCVCVCVFVPIYLLSVCGCECGYGEAVCTHA